MAKGITSPSYAHPHLDHHQVIILNAIVLVVAVLSIFGSGWIILSFAVGAS